MKHRILHESATLVLEYDVVSDYIHAIWAREQTPATIEAGYELILACLGRQHCHRLLDNHAAIHGYWADMAAWFSLDWYPRARRAGLEYHAVVYSTDYLGRRSTEEALHGIVSGAVAGFEDLAVARRALLNQ
ncbi:hypothetical protein [Hymenobacter elongatus]|uniref:Uncharacterized protein n=1 Tax=Hymenobacter elongatus TaxID=877208 RepID=A0A4Z0PPH4_9BACT|nr:hypothetical protein [Hymenobacter elongatus]TGE17373.1 hypothetical protein E5J99_07355 [Hymenobacter elongatus]